MPVPNRKQFPIRPIQRTSRSLFTHPFAYGHSTIYRTFESEVVGAIFWERREEKYNSKHSV